MDNCRLISETIKNIEPSYSLEEINLYKILQKLNSKLISYFKKLIENGFILFANTEFENNNRTFHLTFKEAYLKKDDKELHIIQIAIESDRTNKTINFNHRTITAYDENGHRKAYVLDGYDRIISVLEYNNDPVLKLNFETDVYNTSYEYDTVDNLVKITDALENIFSFTYDSLGGLL